MVSLQNFTSAVAALDPIHVFGTVRCIRAGLIEAIGLACHARIGDHVSIARANDIPLDGEIAALGDGVVFIMAYGPLDGLGEGNRVTLGSAPEFKPDPSWLGHVVDPFGRRLDGRSLASGHAHRSLRAKAPPATLRRRMGARLSTGLSVLDTMLPLVEGQRIGLFAGSGVGKSRLLGGLARHMESDVVVVGLIGERGREVREFVEQTLGAEGMKRCVVVAATSDQPAAVKRRASWAAMATAEYFRDQGRRVLLLFDSITRFAEAHREIALSIGEAPTLGGFPPSTTSTIASLVERAGPGPIESGADITAVFTVLVAGSDMEEPVADIVRGVLDGHVVLDRSIAERGRFPAIDVRRSVSRSLPDAATDDENELIVEARSILGTYEEVLPMLQVGLYKPGGSAQTDKAVSVWPALDAFVAQASPSPEKAFMRLAAVLGHEDAPNDEASE